MGDTIKHLIRFIEKNILEAVNVKNLESNFNYSERHIRRLFKNNTSLSIHPYITQRKMTYALFDLQTNIESVKDLYMKYGYNSHDSFSRAFKRTFNVSPKHFEKLNANIVLKEVTPNILAPLIYFETDENNHNHIYEELYWTDNESKITFKIIDVDNFGNRCIESVINYGFSTHNILKINSLETSNIKLEKMLNELFTIRLENQTNENIVLLYVREINDQVTNIINKLKQRDKICLVVDENKLGNCDIDSIFYHLTVMFNRSTSLSFKDLKKTFTKAPVHFSKINFETFSSIFDIDFEQEFSKFKNLTISLTTKSSISVDLVKSIIKHINVNENFKIQLNPSLNENLISSFEMMIFAN